MNVLNKILIIEDELNINKLIQHRLALEHYVVITAFDGEEGFAKFLVEHPDLIILDVNLPKINGYEVCRRIRREKNDMTPILMLTSKNEDADRIVGRVKGADAYMSKPFDGEKLVAEVKLLLKKGRE